MQNAQFLLGRVISWVFGGFREAQAAILVMDVEEQRAILQPLLPPAHQRDVLRVARDFWTRGRKRKCVNASNIKIAR